MPLVAVTHHISGCSVVPVFLVQIIAALQLCQSHEFLYTLCT